MPDVQIDAGTLTASREDRIVSGLLLPYGEECRSNLGRFTVTAGAVSVPDDLAGMSLNIDHKRERVVGEPVTVNETSAGLFASFRVAKTPEGDKALDDIATGKRKHLSIEASDMKIKDGKATGGRLFAAALVERPAFPSATLLAAAADTEDDNDPSTTTAHQEETYTDENGVTWTRVVDTEVETEDNKTTTTTTVVEETEEPDDEPETEEEEPNVATAPATLTAGKSHESKKSELPELGTIYAAIAGVKSGDFGESATLLAALSDIKISGSGALPATGVLRENWVGKVWQGRTYQRRYINLGQLGTDISAAGKTGFKIGRGTKASPKDAIGGDWAGNKTEIPSGGAFTETVKSTLAKFAGGADIAREFYDLPGGEEVVAAFIELLVEDYAKWSDKKALASFVAAAGDAVAPDTYPSTYSDSKALGMLLQGIYNVHTEDDVASFAIVNSTAYKQLLYTAQDKIPEYINFSVTTEGTATADGSVSVVAADDAAFGDAVDADTPAVIVGQKRAIEFDELGSTPLHVDALELAKGGVDRAVHGYLQTFRARDESVVLIGTKTQA